jgi:exodeoxyribonuclease V alpha subunit
VAFVSSDGRVRWISPHRLPRHETVYAMSIHKSQGSEFDHAVVVIPDAFSEILSRELIYTAITRARRKVTIFAPPEVLSAAIARRIQRHSGLQERLWKR